MDKDQVLKCIVDGDPAERVLAACRVSEIYAELESLRAMRKWVEDEIDQFDRSDVPVVNWCADVLRAALGDSHEQ